MADVIGLEAICFYVFSWLRYYIPLLLGQQDQQAGRRGSHKHAVPAGEAVDAPHAALPILPLRKRCRQLV